MGTIREDDDQDDSGHQRETQEHDVEVENEKVEEPEERVEIIEEESGDDERTASGNEDEGDDTDETDKKARKKETAAERRARAKLAKERDKRELDFQRRVIADQDRRLKQLENGQTVSRVTELDNRIATALQDVETMDKIKAKAIDKSQGADVVAADNLRNQAAERAREAMHEKQQIIHAAKQTQAQAPSYEPLAREFMSNNPWYNHDGSDEDSLIVKAIDAAVAREFNPNSPAYWNELQSRIAKRLPQHFNDTSNDEGDDEVEQRETPAPRKRGGPPTGGSSRGNSSTVTQVRLSPDRVQAMKDAGIWEDPAQRAKMAKAYANYDRQNNSRG